MIKNFHNVFVDVNIYCRSLNLNKGRLVWLICTDEQRNNISNLFLLLKVITVNFCTDDCQYTNGRERQRIKTNKIKFLFQHGILVNNAMFRRLVVHLIYFEKRHFHQGLQNSLQFLLQVHCK